MVHVWRTKMAAGSTRSLNLTRPMSAARAKTSRKGFVAGRIRHHAESKPAVATSGGFRQPRTALDQ